MAEATKPALQALQEVLPAALATPPEQARQADWAGAALYLPGAHAVQSEDIVPALKEPALHGKQLTEV